MADGVEAFGEGWVEKEWEGELGWGARAGLKIRF